MYPGNKRKKLWREEKERLLKMTLEERRKEYLRDYVPLKDIPTWKEEMKNKAQSDEDNTNEAFLMQKSLSEKVSLYRGDITVLEIDAIVNAANSSLLGGGGVDGCIHRAAGPCLVAECRSLSGCETGQAKITCGYDLPAKYVIHTVGPIARGHISDIHKEDLANCYKTSLKLAKEKLIRSIAFPCISTGIYGFPNEPAAVIALTTVKEWLSKNENEMDRVIFCVFLEVDYKIYKKKMNDFFPTGENGTEVKPSNDEPEPQSQEEDEAVSIIPSSPADGGENLGKEKESPDTKEPNPVPHATCEEDQADGLQDDSSEVEMNTQADSQISYMEAEDTLITQEETGKEEKPLSPEVDKPNQESKGQDKGAEEEKGKQVIDSVQPEGQCDTENISSIDVEMNSQVENIEEPTQSQTEN
ncbi:O-acetyl-ADP-ribose deacetylase MACROD2 isoform X3 [Pseudonaja textilis]|uniref:O-acetyl-ADP-ribose deacetylase MACROD2 isoform X3 n=1 Tax=Pseudonaja textilis TaxID=8673 RepID=UPI000EA8F2AC|nr:O-acetyl-ADP-ribose deacetylase MACROD2 isoform X3 [Pseudonaja textilis]